MWFSHLIIKEPQEVDIIKEEDLNLKTKYRKINFSLAEQFKIITMHSKNDPVMFLVSFEG